MAVSPIQVLVRRAGRVSTVVEVGAFDGVNSLPLAAQHPEIQFIAVEPTPTQAAELRERSRTLANYTVVEAAVSTNEGYRAFNTFRAAPTLNSLHQLTPEGTDLFNQSKPEPDETCLVETKSLARICDELNLATIDVLHIDTQGSDLEVISSLDAERISRVRVGAIEIPYRTSLYDSGNSARTARKMLIRLGFRIFHVSRLAYYLDWEHNYYFVRCPKWQTRIGVPFLSYWIHLAGCELNAAAKRLRYRLAIGTHLRAAASGMRKL